MKFIFVAAPSFRAWLERRRCASINFKSPAFYVETFCSAERASNLGSADGQALIEKRFDTHFNTCHQNIHALLTNYNSTYAIAYDTALKQKEQTFISTTGTSNFQFNSKPVSAICNISSDQSSVKVVVNNPNPENMLINGGWTFQYFDRNYNLITSDSSAEAVLLTPNSSKTFLKMTLPKNANFCRAEFTGSIPKIL